MRKNKGAEIVSTLIGEDVVFEGNVSAPESIRVDGTLNGNCECKEQLIVGSSGSIKGDVNARSVRISGKVEGNVYADGQIELLSTGVIEGNISAKSIVIDEGACFDGRCTMTNAEIVSYSNDAV